MNVTRPPVRGQKRRYWGGKAIADGMKRVKCQWCDALFQDDEAMLMHSKAKHKKRQKRMMERFAKDE